MKISSFLSDPLISLCLIAILAGFLAYAAFQLFVHKFGWASACRDKGKLQLRSGRRIQVVSPNSHTCPARAHGYIRDCGYRMLTAAECYELHFDERTRQKLAHVVARNADGTFSSIDMSVSVFEHKIGNQADIDGCLIFIKKTVEENASEVKKPIAAAA